MRIGYSYWGFLGDQKLDANGKELSTPDGNATYSWAILHEALRRRHDVYAMQEDRDEPAYDKLGLANFNAFSRWNRCSAYGLTKQTVGTDNEFPELDVLLLEWRMPIIGRNCERAGDGFLYYDPKIHQPDWERQRQLLDHYGSKDTKIIVWDLDHKFMESDELESECDAIFETSARPRRFTMDRISVEFPTLVRDLLQYPTKSADLRQKLVYIGSRYERDDVITEWIKPASERFPGMVWFYGNWLKSLDECKKLWPCVNYQDRITTSGFREAYGEAVACPLLAKRSYLETGFITPRPYEALLFGTLPIGLKTHLGVERYVLPGHIAESGEHMVELVEEMSNYAYHVRDMFRRNNVEQLEFMDAKYFVDKIEDVVSKTLTQERGTEDGKTR